MSTIQRQACFSLRGLAFGRANRYRAFARAIVRLADGTNWRHVDLSARQLYRLAQAVRRFRRQIDDPDLLFWSQRVLAEDRLLRMEMEEPCQSETANVPSS